MKAGSSDKMPAAMMITGRLYEEATLLRVALAYEQGTKWKEMNPALSSRRRGRQYAVGSRQ